MGPLFLGGTTSSEMMGDERDGVETFIWAGSARRRRRDEVYNTVVGWAGGVRWRRRDGVETFIWAGSAR